MLLTSFFQGFGTGGGLIVAIGAQNAFVLSQSIRKNHQMLIALICIFCDVLFISLGIAGLGSTVAQNPILAKWVSLGGAMFLFYYGWNALKSAIRGGRLDAEERESQSIGVVILATFGVTLLNPHFYLDTVILLGSISSSFQDQERLFFWGGAVTASSLWFISLSLGGRILAPIFQKELAWKILDSIIWITMWSIAASLLLPYIP